MAKKKIDIEIGVDQSQLDNAVAKAGELKKLSEKISIQYDINGKPLDVVIDKTLSLKKQVRALTEELGKTQKGTQEFQILSTKLGDVKDKLKQTTAGSQDLFGSLSLLPGPIGTFASQLGGALDLLKTFSSYSLKDIQFQLKETGNDILDIFKNFNGTNTATKELAQTTDTLTNSTDNLNTSIATTATNVGGLTGALNTGGKEWENYDNAVGQVYEKHGLLITQLPKMINGQEVMTDVIKQSDGSYRDLTKSELGAIASGKALTITTEGYVTVTKMATFWSSTLGKTIQGVLIGTGVGIAILLIGALVKLIYDWVDGTEEADAANKALTETIKEQQRVLENDQQAIELSTRLNVARAKAAGKTEQEIYQITKKGGQDKLDLLREYDKQLVSDQQKVIKDKNLKAEEANKLLEDINAKYLKNGQDITKQIIENAIMEEEYKGNIRTKGLEKNKKDAEDEYQRKLKELDAKIQLEIDKDATDRKVLQDHLDTRRKMVSKHDKLSYSEQELMRQQNAKKVKDAGEEDEKRIEAFFAKQADLEIAAIEDEQQRQEQARLQKLNQDKLALSYDVMFQKASQEEKNKILLDMETAYQMDLLKIRDSFYMKKFQKDAEARQKEIENQTKLHEGELATNQMRIDSVKEFNTIYGDYIFGNKGLKGIWEKYFVDLREVYNKDFQDTQTQLLLEKDTLKTAYDEKKITLESYETQIAQINDRIRANRETNSQRQLQLDRLELDSKRANADMTIQIGERLTSALGAIAGKNRAIQKAAAIAEGITAIARIITDTTRAIASFSASVAPLGPVGVPIAAAYAVKAKISAALGIATIIGSSIGKLKSIDESDMGGTSSSSTPQGNGLGRGYADGGLIGGRRHAQGGTIIEAEQGEAIMTRGAVTMFGPLLSTLNQMGGGTSFSNALTTRPDNPILSNPAQEQAPIIVKSYVVENDLTTSQHKQARLKDLSTL
jgi:hypothetical protein